MSYIVHVSDYHVFINLSEQNTFHGMRCFAKVGGLDIIFISPGLDGIPPLSAKRCAHSLVYPKGYLKVSYSIALWRCVHCLRSGREPGSVQYLNVPGTVD